MELRILNNNELPTFMKEMQEAFQKGFENRFGKTENLVLPESDIVQSLNTPHSVTFEVIEDGERLGGAIIALSDDGQRGDLHLLYTKVGCQNRGVATFVWRTIESLYPEVTVWETHTPYFEVRNIHFYVNRCGFHIVEFFNPHHPDPHDFSERSLNPMGEDGFFRFQKVITGM